MDINISKNKKKKDKKKDKTIMSYKP
jgi:hypothetical protein